MPSEPGRAEGRLVGSQNAQLTRGTARPSLHPGCYAGITPWFVIEGTVCFYWILVIVSRHLPGAGGNATPATPSRCDS